MAKKDLTQGMAKGLGSLLQPTTATQTVEPTKEQPRETAAQAIETNPKYIVVGVRKKKAGAGRPKSKKAKADPQKKTSSVTMGLRDGFTRSTIICNIETLAKVREIAYLERTPLMDIFEDALNAYVTKYENKHGEVVPPAPKQKR